MYAQRNPYQVQTHFFTAHKLSCSHSSPGAGRCLPRWETTELLDRSTPALTLCRSPAPALGQQDGMVARSTQPPTGSSWPSHMLVAKERSQQGFALQVLTITAPGCFHRGDVPHCPARDRRGLSVATTTATCIGRDFPSELLLSQEFPTPQLTPCNAQRLPGV